MSSAGVSRGKREIAFDHPSLQGAPVHVRQAVVEQGEDEVEAIRGSDGTARWVWDAAAPLAAWLCERPKIVQGKRVIELGAGLGLTGLVAARLGAAEVLLTDVEAALERLDQQIKTNDLKNCRVQRCFWGDSEDIAAIGTCDVVICSDLVYAIGDDVALALVDTMKRLAHSGTLLLVNYQVRENLLGDQIFFETCDEAFDGGLFPITITHEGKDTDESGEQWFFVYRPKTAGGGAAGPGELKCKACGGECEAVVRGAGGAGQGGGGSAAGRFCCVDCGEVKANSSFAAWGEGSEDPSADAQFL